jgi:hypothetical protein
MNAWILAALLSLFGDVYERPFHAAYIVFSLIAAAAMWALARRFSPHPFWATLLFIAMPAFVINGNSFESDLPFLAFWMTSVALFVSGRYVAAALALVLASLTAFQAVFLTPILALYVWLFDRKRHAAWMISLTPVITLGAWQIFERLTTGALPAAVLTGYFQSYGFQALEQKVRNAVALTVHACWMLAPVAVVIALKRRQPKTTFLLGWIAIFFAGALAVFFAGSARYLLPMAAPVALLLSHLRPAWLAPVFALHVTVSLSLAAVNYQHWDAYRRFVATLPSAQRTWINGDWGLRFYLESAGGLPLERGQTMRPGDLVVTSELSQYTTVTGTLARTHETEIRPSLPLRLIGLDTRSGYSTAARGLLPFGISNGPIDRVRAETVLERKATLESLPMNAPEAEQQIVSGVYSLEEHRWRWIGERAVFLLKRPAAPKPLRVSFFIPDSAPARRIMLLLDGVEVAAQTYNAPGAYQLTSTPVSGETVTVAVDRTFSVPPDRRQLGIILTGIGFAP